MNFLNPKPVANFCDLAENQQYESVTMCEPFFKFILFAKTWFLSAQLARLTPFLTLNYFFPDLRVGRIRASQILSHVLK